MGSPIDPQIICYYSATSFQDDPLISIYFLKDNLVILGNNFIETAMRTEVEKIFYFENVMIRNDNSTTGPQ